MYPRELTDPIARDLTDFGFKGLTDASEVTEYLDKEDGTVLVVVNSVCGCAASMARPGVKLALANGKKPDEMITVFAGVDHEATQKAREYMLPYPPSSPSIALFKDGKLVHMLERRNIEGFSAHQIAASLEDAFEKFC